MADALHRRPRSAGVHNWRRAVHPHVLRAHGTTGGSLMASASIATQVSLKTILFATDFSDASEKAVPFTAALARKHQSKVFIAHVLPEPQPAVTRPGISVRDERIRTEAANQIQDFANAALFKTVPHEEILLEGSCWSTLEQ